MPGIEDLQNKKAGQSLNNFLNADPKQIAFGIEAQINNLMGEYEMAIRNGEMARAEMLNNKINELDKMKIDIANQSGRTISNIDSGRTISDIDRQMDILGRTASSEDKIKILNQMKETFGKDLLMNIASGNVVGKNFSNLDREIASKLYIGVSPEDILRPKYGDAIKGYAEGDEVSMMMMELEDDQGMSKSDMEGLEELAEISGPETEMLNNIINQIIELIAQGATEEEVIAFLKQQGLDDEDISAVMSMLSQQLTAGEEDIGSQLAALG